MTDAAAPVYVAAYDGGEAALAALERAIQLAGATGARLVVVHATDGDEDALDVVGELVEARGVTCETRAVTGRPAAAILDTADAVGAELIVVGAPESSLVGRLLAGSVGDEVARKAQADVLLVHIRRPEV